MRYGIVDLGTLSIRFDIYQIQGRGIPKLLRAHRDMLRLGESIYANGRIDEAAADRSCEQFRKIAALAKEYNTDEVVAVATSALRDAVGGQALLERIHTETDITVRIISGDEEARLTAQGVLANEQRLPERLALVDIGGGSTEFSFYENGNVLFCESLAIGALRVQQLLLRTHPPDAVAVSAARKQIRSLLSQFDGRWSEKPALIGSSGSVKAMLRIRSGAAASEEIKTGELPRAKIDSLVGEMTPLDAGGLLQIPNMDPHRIEVILAGALITQEIVSYFGGDTVRVTDYSLRDGLYDEIGEALGVQR